MKNKILKSKYIIVSLVLSLVGICLLYISESYFKEIWKIIFSQIAVAILISVIIGIINEYVLKESLVDMILEKIKIKEDVNKTGLEELVSSIGEINYKYYFKSASKNIDIVHVYGRSWTNSNIDEIQDRVMKSNCKVRVILVDPESKFIEGLEGHFDYDSGRLKEEIKNVSLRWKEIYDKKNIRNKKATQGHIELYYHKGHPSNALYRIDDRIIVVHTKTTKGRTTRIPAMIFKDTKKNDCFYNIYLKEIDELVNQSTKVDFKNL